MGIKYVIISSSSLSLVMTTNHLINSIVYEIQCINPEETLDHAKVKKASQKIVSLVEEYQSYQTKKPTRWRASD